MKKIHTQDVNVATAVGLEELENFKELVAAIPFPKKKYWLNELLLDKEVQDETAFAATYEFLCPNQDTWFWISVRFRKDGTSVVDFYNSYTVYNERRLLPVVNRFLERIGLEARPELHIMSGPDDFTTWQEGYEFLCMVSQKNRKWSVVS